MALLGLIAPACCEGGVPWKPRIVVLTDIAPAEVEPDDLQSLVRLLAYADRPEIEALIFSTGWNTSGGHSNWIEFIYQAIDAYERDLPHLQRRSEQTEFLTDESRQPLGYWPTPRYLRSVTMPGSQKRGMEHVGPDNDSPGSAWILRLADERDERPIWVLAWGGGNTLAQALWRARQERSPEAFDRLLRKLRFYAITDQDRSYTKGTPYDVSSHSWMRREFEGRLKVIWDECAWLLHNGTGRQRWDEYAARIQGHGHLGAIYPKYKYGVEGDTPSFLYVLPNGLNDPEHPNHGGWGGYFEWGTGPDGATRAWVNHQGTRAHEVCRRYWDRLYPDMFLDCAARMAWARDGVGNRNPWVVVNGNEGVEPLVLTVAPGGSVLLDATGSRDPDGQNVRVGWWVFTEAGTFAGPVTLEASQGRQTRLYVPPDATGKTIHVVCEVRDDGNPPLVSYRRVICTVQDQRGGE
jgi:hypothetical protein